MIVDIRRTKSEGYELSLENAFSDRLIRIKRTQIHSNRRLKTKWVLNLALFYSTCNFFVILQGIVSKFGGHRV